MCIVSVLLRRLYCKWLRLRYESSSSYLHKYECVYVFVCICVLLIDNVCVLLFSTLRFVYYQNYFIDFLGSQHWNQYCMLDNAYRWQRLCIKFHIYVFINNTHCSLETNVDEGRQLCVCANGRSNFEATKGSQRWNIRKSGKGAWGSLGKLQKNSATGVEWVSKFSLLEEDAPSNDYVD